MKLLNAAIGALLTESALASEFAAKAARATQVENMWEAAIKACCGASAELMLSYTNSVFIFKGVSNFQKHPVNGISPGAFLEAGSKREESYSSTLVVYVEDSLIAAELNARREMLRLKLFEMFGEQIDTLRICISSGKYKLNHPFLKERKKDDDKEMKERKPLSKKRRADIEKKCSAVADDNMREALERAIIDDLELNYDKNIKKDEINA